MHFLEKKSEKLVIGKTNKNDIFELLGPPSTKGSFDEELWIYMEIQTSSSKLSKLGKKKLLKNNILLLDIDNKGILTKSIFFDKDKMNEIKLLITKILFLNQEIQTFTFFLPIIVYFENFYTIMGLEQISGVVFS